MDSKKQNNLTFGECRCCLVKGQHKDLMKEYKWNGNREVYFDMFLECFNLFLSTSIEGALICNECVQKLREAKVFRAMVLKSEETLLSALQQNSCDSIFVNVSSQPMETDTDVSVKSELLIPIKSEPEEWVADEVGMDDEDPEDTSSPHPVDYEEMERNLLLRFPNPPPLPNRESLQDICPEYFRQLEKLRGKLITGQMIAKLLEAQDTHLQKKRKIFITEKVAQMVNISTMLENSNIIPFRSKAKCGFPCFYCRSNCENVQKLRNHINEHSKTEAKDVLKTIGPECMVVYVDISGLKCTICDQNQPNLIELRNHLIKVHDKKMYTEFTDRIIPFKLSEDNVYECQICGFSFETFGSIERHMNVHFRNYVCKQCGSGFVTKYRLKVHSKSMHVDGSFPCEVCKKIFTTHQKHKNHVDTVHKLLKRFKCPKCPEKFKEYFGRQKHMVLAHGVAPLQYKCNVCDKSFDRRYTLSRHLKRDHLEERENQCELCSYKCFTRNELRVHMVKHNGERVFECSVCKKAYARKKTLREHMRIHNNDRRFSCAVCGQAFVQKCSLKGHMKTHHVEYSL